MTNFPPELLEKLIELLPKERYESDAENYFAVGANEYRDEATTALPAIIEAYNEWLANDLKNSFEGDGNCVYIDDIITLLTNQNKV